jgi:ureidoacrylate peracid hydrolase
MEFENVEMRGKEILTTLGEKVNPQHTALLLIDMQNDYAKLGGKCHKAGRPLGHYEKAIPNIQAFLKEARNYGLLVVHVITTVLPYGLGDSGAWLDQRVRSPYTDLTMCLEGTWGEQIVEELAPIFGEAIVKKLRYSGFAGTPLDIILRSNEIKTLIVTGVSTNVCIDNTVRDGFFLNYYIILVEDCTYSWDQELRLATFKTVKKRFGMVISSKQISKVWGNQYNPTKK